jgi:hypothetical protein
MASNSKLSQGQKIILREMLNDAELDGIHVVNLDDVTTMVYHGIGDTVQFSLAVKSADEKRFRFKVGQYHALNRFFNDQYVTMNREDFELMCENVWDVYPL